MNSTLNGLGSGAWPATERSEGERSEPQRSAVAGQAGAGPAPRAQPGPEVLAKPKRRTFRAEYKSRILQEAAAAEFRPSGTDSEQYRYVLMPLRL